MGYARRMSTSPVPEGACYCHDPYSRENPFKVVNAAPPQYTAPTDMIHPALVGKVSFMPFPTMAYPVPSPVEYLEKADMSRLFLGQLPYGVTDMELAWLFGEIAHGSQGYYTERIMKKSQVAASKQRMPTGCIHTYCDPRDVPMMIEALNKRVLFDDCGIWYAASPAQYRALHEYCKRMKDDASLRPADRPYQPVVVQEAHSTYVPNERDKRANATRSPPPMYGHSY